MKKQEIDTELERNSMISFSLIMISNLLSAVFQIISGKCLDDVQLYGELNAIFSLYNILVIPNAIFAFIVSKYMAEIWFTRERGEAKSFLKSMGKILIGLAVLMTLGEILFAGNIRQYLNIDNNQYTVFLIALVAVAVVTPLATGSLQGMKAFVAYGVIGIIGPLFKVLGVLISTKTDQKIECILLVMLTGSVLAVAIGLGIVFRKTRSYQRVELKVTWKTIIKFGIMTCIVNIGLTLMQNIDMLLIKHYFNEMAGEYSVALVLGKLTQYIASAIVVVLFPMTVVAKTEQESRQMLKKSLIYTGVLSALALLVLYVMGAFIIRLLYGNQYMGAVDYIVPVAFMIFPINFITILVNYALGIGKYKVMAVSLIGEVCIDYLLILLFHKSILEVIGILTLMNAVVAIINTVYFMKKDKI